ncbi:MAG: Fic family protein [Pseudonocardiaceae bacterium]
MDHGRDYRTSHPWITFQFRIEQDLLWCLLGEAAAQCQHLAGTPLQPALADELSGVYLVKGAVATTAIEGNTLTEDEVRELLDSRRKLPPSQQYLQQEIENVIEGLRRIDEAARAGEPFTVTPEWIKDQNRLILKDLDTEDHVVPGEYTEVRLFAGNYRGAPPQDVEYLVDRLCAWLSELLSPLDDPSSSNEMRLFCSFVAATLAHLYIAWIHPFGDGNGRTARLLECAILAHSGVVPWVSSNLLSDHYNRTRSRYYQRLDRASRASDVRGFITYSAQGYVDMLREQIDRVQVQQRRVAWVNYVHGVMQRTPDGATQKRQRMVVLSLPTDRGVRRAEIRRLTPDLAEMYAGKTDKTLSRDVNRLHELGLIRRQGNLWWSRIDLMDAFLPIARNSSY